MDEFTYVLFRYSSGPVSTLGLLMAGSMEMGSAFRCFTLEDEFRTEKIPEHTRIPAGTYELNLRTEGDMHGKYKERYHWHRGMLWLQDVPNFSWIYIHPGNLHDQTAGCILVGDGAVTNLPRVGEGKVTSSVQSYKALYQEIVELMDLDKKVLIEIRDIA